MQRVRLTNRQSVITANVFAARQALVRDQGVGGSNPLCPTKFFSKLRATSGFAATVLADQLLGHFPKKKFSVTPPTFQFCGMHVEQCSRR